MHEKDKRHTGFLGRGRRRSPEEHARIVAEIDARKAAEQAALRPKDRERFAIAGRKRPAFCDVCGGDGGKMGIVWDHCHVNGHFRGWLCSGCNTALGMVKDNPETLRLLAKYLEADARRLALAGGCATDLPIFGGEAIRPAPVICHK